VTQVTLTCLRPFRILIFINPLPIYTPDLTIRSTPSPCTRSPTLRRSATIVTDLGRIDHRIAMTQSLRKAIGFFHRHNIYNLSDGNMDIFGDRVFAMIQRDETIMADAS
jgi:hypothetical protein